MSVRGMGRYELIPGSGIWVPDAGELAKGAAAGATGAAALSLAQSQGVQAAAQSAAGEAIGTRLIKFYKDSPVLAWGLTLSVGALVVYGAMSFLKK